jgi:hypothetical protein
MATLQSRPRPSVTSSLPDNQTELSHADQAEAEAHDDDHSFVLFGDENQSLDASTASSADMDARWSVISSLPAHDGHGVFALSDYSASPPVSSIRSLSVSSADLDALDIPSSLSSAGPISDYDGPSDDEDDLISPHHGRLYPSPPPESSLDLTDPVIVSGRKRRYRRSGTSDRGSKRSNTSSSASRMAKGAETVRPAAPTEQTDEPETETDRRNGRLLKGFFFDRLVRRVFLVDDEMLGMLGEAHDDGDTVESVTCFPSVVR